MFVFSLHTPCAYRFRPTNFSPHIVDKLLCLPYILRMNTIQQTMTVPQDRRLRLDVPLPDTINTGWMNVQIFIQPLHAEPPREKRPYKSICGIIEGQGVTVESFLAEKRADDAIEFAREGR
jgi:hypothetical protein